MPYTEIVFQGRCIREQQNYSFKNSLIAASFTAWQIGTQNGLKMSWENYLKNMGLLEKVKYVSDKKYLEEQASLTLDRVNKILKKAANKNG